MVGDKRYKFSLWENIQTHIKWMFVRGEYVQNLRGNCKVGNRSENQGIGKTLLSLSSRISEQTHISNWSFSALILSSDHLAFYKENLDGKFSYYFGVVLFSCNSCCAHLLDKEVYQLAVHRWVCGDRFANVFIPHLFTKSWWHQQ